MAWKFINGIPIRTGSGSPEAVTESVTVDSDEVTVDSDDVTIDSE